MYLDDRLPQHPKILKAGASLGGKDGTARAFTMYTAAIAYARLNLTDGIIPIAFVEKFPYVSDPKRVARVLAAKRIGLWRKVPAGYAIHDYHAYNDKAADIKDKREKARLRKHAQRARESGRFSPAVTSGRPRDGHRDSRARARQVPSTNRGQCDKYRTGSIVPTEIYKPAAARPVISFPDKKTTTHRILCAMIRAELAADPAIDVGSLIEAVKVRIVRQGFAYPHGDALATAIDSVDVARARARRLQGIA